MDIDIGCLNKIAPFYGYIYNHVQDLAPQRLCLCGNPNMYDHQRDHKSIEQFGGTYVITTTVGYCIVPNHIDTVVVNRRV